MIGRKKQPQIQRSPQIMRQKQSTFQYSSNRAPSERLHRTQPQEEEKQREFSIKIERFQHRAGVLASVALIILFMGYFSLLTAAPRVVITNNQQPIRDAATYNQAAQDAADSGLFGSSKFTVNRQKISDNLEAKFPELVTADVTTPFFGRSIVVTATVSQPAAILATNSASYMLDSRGVALFDTRKQQGKTSVKTDSLMLINDQSGIPIEVGKPALTSAQIDFAKEVKRQADAKQMPIEQMTLGAGGGELLVKHDGLPYVVKYNLYEDARKSFGTFYATKEYLDGVKETPKEYVDVRVPERAYTK